MYKEANIYRMANDTIVKFIELYRSCECLWNESSEDYGCRLSRNTAYDAISRKMRISGFGPREVARKIKNLRSAYQRELQRIEENERNSGVRIMNSAYRPRAIWFELLDDFLGNSGRSCQFDRRSDGQTELPEKALTTGERVDSVINSPKKRFCSSVSRKRRSSAYDAYRTADEGQRKVKKKQVDDEEYESFGKYVASSLSKMPFEYAVSAETEIHSVIIKYKVYAMRKIVYPTTTGTTTTTRMGMRREATTRRSPSTYLPISNFSSVRHQRTEEARPSFDDSIGHASD